jgi:hypothetical protein
MALSGLVGDFKPTVPARQLGTCTVTPPPPPGALEGRGKHFVGRYHFSFKNFPYWQEGLSHLQRCVFLLWGCFDTKT